MAESISFRCKGFRWPFWLSIFVLVNFTMTIMFLTFSIGLPLFVSVAALLLSMVFGIGILAGHMEYRLTQEGITQEIRPLKWSLIKLPGATRQFKWEEIKSYESGEDLSRGLQRYHFLYISISRFPYQLRLSDHQASKEELAAFEMAFQSMIETGVMVSANQAREIPKMATPNEDGQRVSSGVSQSTNIDDAVGRVIPVRRRPDFYQSRGAHLLFWFFVLLFAVIGYQMVVTRNSNPTNYWRMAIVVVPGMTYFAWRLYGRQRPR
jgi:hypothetical protein